MLKVMTLNINLYGSRHGLWSTRQVLIRDAILANKPEIVALQAVRQEPNATEHLDQATQLAKLLQPTYPHSFFQPAMYHPDGSIDGLALLSTVPVAGIDHLPLTLQPGLDDTNRRVLLRARFDSPDGPIHLFNGHFSWVPAQNLANVEEALPYLNNAPGPAVLVGDLNATPDSEAMQRLRDAGWTDAWAALRPQDPGYTFESDQPTLRIDYAWLNPDLQPYLKRIDIVAQAQDGSGARASDHFGLLLSLDIETQAGRTRRS